MNLSGYEKIGAFDAVPGDDGGGLRTGDCREVGADGK